MASHSQIVPSKNALRALRKLALGGSTVVGAVGSVSGLACASYDIRQRIHLAESIVETKRILHSQPISNPNRKAQMAAIFDMYEKGQGKEGNESWQDFNRRAQRHSAPANLVNGHNPVDTMNKENPIHSTDITSRPQTSKSTVGSLYTSLGRSTMPSNPPWERMRVLLEETASSYYDQNSSTVQRIIEATQKSHKVHSYTVYGRPRESRDISPVQKIITATQQQHKLKSHVVFGRPTKRKDQVLPELASCVQQWLGPTDENRARTTHRTLPRRPDLPRKVTRRYESVRQYSALATKLQDDVDDPAMWPFTAKSQYNDPFFPNNEKNPNIGEHSHDLDLVSLQPVQKNEGDVSLEENDFHETSHAQSEEPDPDTKMTTQDVRSKLLMLIDSVLWKSDTAVEEVRDISAYPTSLTNLAPPSTGFRISGTVESTGEHTTMDANYEPSTVLEKLFATIPQIRRRSGIFAARKLTLDALDIYAQGGRPEDFHAIDQLLLEFATKLRLPWGSSISQLIHYLLNTGVDEDRRRAGRLLFRFDLGDLPSDDCASSVVRYQYERRALRHIDWLCSTPASNSNVVRNFRKVLEAMYRQGSAPSEALFSPILDRFLERGDLKYLRNMFDEMKAVHGIEPGTLTRTILLLGYANANDWSQVTTEFETMHKDGFSRKEPVSYAVMFDEVLREHAASEPVEKTHDFLVNAICYWGLVPITKVSTTAVQTYIRHRRYDLVKEWIEAARYMFPHVDNTGSRLAYSLAETWGEIGASCEEIEDACVSIIRGRDNVVPGRFRGMVQEALAGHLARKLHAINSDGVAFDDYVNQDENHDDLSTQLKSAFATILEDAGENRVVKQSSVADLLAQSSAALRLRELFGAKTRITAPDVELAPRLDRTQRKQTIRHKPQSKDLATPIPEVLQRDLLPDRETVMSLVSAWYRQRLKLGEPVSHDILKVTCRQLNQTRRRYDILTLISHTYKEPAVQGPNGVMFDLDIMQTWMEAAYHLKSPMACKEIFTAILEKGTAIRLTKQFMLLVSMASRKAFGTKFSVANRHLARDIAELKHLQDRLRDRFYTQRNMPQAKTGRRYDGMLNLRNADTISLFGEQS